MRNRLPTGWEGMAIGGNLMTQSCRGQTRRWIDSFGKRVQLWVVKKFLVVMQVKLKF
jgi:hypothetical protein